MREKSGKGADLIRCAGCGQWGENAGHLLLSKEVEGDRWERIGPLCLECMDWTRRQMRRTARPDRVDEVRVLGREA